MPAHRNNCPPSEFQPQLPMVVPGEELPAPSTDLRASPFSGINFKSGQLLNTPGGLTREQQVTNAFGVAMVRQEIQPTQGTDNGK